MIDRDDLIDFLRDNLKIRISKEIHTQYNDYEYTQKLQVSLYMYDRFREVEIDSDYIAIDDLLRK